MKIEDIVCDLKYSQKLKEFGIKFDSYSYYVKTSLEKYEIYTHLSVQDAKGGKDIFSAFTVDELLDIIPKGLDINETPYFMNIHYCDGWNVNYNNIHGKLIEFNDSKLSNAITLLMIWCVEEGFLNYETGMSS